MPSVSTVTALDITAAKAATYGSLVRRHAGGPKSFLQSQEISDPRRAPPRAQACAAVEWSLRMCWTGRAFAAVVSLRELPTVAPHFLALASASFMYVAMALLIPEMHRDSIHVTALWQVASVTAGVVTVALL